MSDEFVYEHWLNLDYCVLFGKKWIKEYLAREENKYDPNEMSRKAVIKKKNFYVFFFSPSKLTFQY